MLYLVLRGRLENQFFQYAAVNAFRKKNQPDETIGLYINDLVKLGTVKEGFKNSLFDYHVNHCVEVEKMEIKFIQKILIFMMKVPNVLVRLIGLLNFADRFTYQIERRLQPFLNYFGVYYMIHGYVKFRSSNSKNKVFIGNFESAAYFDEIKEDLYKEFAPKENKLDKNLKMYQLSEKYESICISIRRGDFVSSDTFKKIHYICDINYFKKAIQAIESIIEHPQFMVFSDDIEWVKENMNFSDNTVFENGQDPVWEKLRLMYSCKHFIISNSIFSWWTQYLSRNQSKMVMAPSIWKRISYKKELGKIDIYQADWTLIDIEKGGNDI